jgi:RNA polymerase sigma-70 factor (ECF subfamily)
MISNYRDAEEAAQDVFVKAYQSLDKFKGDSSFSTWLYRIGTNHCLDILRKRNRRKNVSLEALMEEGGPVQKFFVTSSQADIQLENRQLIDKILSTLSGENRRVLILKESLGLECQEIANVLGCSEGSVKGRLARARKQLRENLSHSNLMERWLGSDSQNRAKSLSFAFTH